MEGDEEYHKDLMVPVLLVYGLLDKFVNLDEEEWMEEVCTTEYAGIYRLNRDGSRAYFGGPLDDKYGTIVVPKTFRKKLCHGTFRTFIKHLAAEKTI